MFSAEGFIPVISFNLFSKSLFKSTVDFFIELLYSVLLGKLVINSATCSFVNLILFSSINPSSKLFPSLLTHVLVKFLPNSEGLLPITFIIDVGVNFCFNVNIEGNPDCKASFNCEACSVFILSTARMAKAIS